VRVSPVLQLPGDTILLNYLSILSIKFFVKSLKSCLIGSEEELRLVTDITGPE